MGKRSNKAEKSLLEVEYFKCSEYILSIPWHLLSFCLLMTFWSSYSLGISSLTWWLSEGSIWGKFSGFSISGWGVTGLGENVDQSDM